MFYGLSSQTLTYVCGGSCSAGRRGFVVMHAPKRVELQGRTGPQPGQAPAEHRETRRLADVRSGCEGCSFRWRLRGRETEGEEKSSDSPNESSQTRSGTKRMWCHQSSYGHASGDAAWGGCMTCVYMCIVLDVSRSHHLRQSARGGRNQPRPAAGKSLGSSLAPKKIVQ